MRPPFWLHVEILPKVAGEDLMMRVQIRRWAWLWPPFWLAFLRWRRETPIE